MFLSCFQKMMGLGHMFNAVSAKCQLSNILLLSFLYLNAQRFRKNDGSKCIEQTSRHRGVFGMDQIQA